MYAWARDLRAEIDRRYVYGRSLAELFMMKRDLKGRSGIDFPDAVSDGIGCAWTWSMTRWFDDQIMDPPSGYAHGLWETMTPAFTMSGAITGAVYIESIRRVLHTVIDVRRGRVPGFLPVLLERVEAYDAMSKLSARDRERARPVARELEERVLAGALRRVERKAA